MQCNLLNFCLLIAYFCSTEDKALQKNSTGKQVNLRVSKVWKRGHEVWRRRDAALQEEDRKWSGLGLERGKWKRVMSQAGYCSSASPGAVSLLRNMFWGLRGHDSATGTDCEQLFGQALQRGHRGTAVPKVSQSREGLGLQSTSSLDGSAARHWDYTSNFLFLFLGRLMILWQKGRLTEEWRREMWEVLERFIFKKQCNIQEEMSRKELGIQDWRGNLWMICKSSY